MIDIFSRYVVGWMLVRRSNAEVAKHFIGAILARENIAPGQAVVHADRGTEMTAQPLCVLLDSWRCSIAQPSSRQRRQRLLRIEFQDAEIPSNVSGAFRLS